MRCVLGERCGFDHDRFETLYKGPKRHAGWRKGDHKGDAAPMSLERHLEVIEALKPFRNAGRQAGGILGCVELTTL